MVFGWGKKKEKKSDETPIQKDIELSEVKKITNDLLNLRKTQTMAEIKSLRKRTSPLMAELSSIIRNLEKDDLKVDDIDKHLRIIVVRGKKQVIDVIKKESSSLPDISSFDDVLDLHDGLNQKLKKIGDVLGRQTRVIHIFAKKYAEKLKEILAEMNSNNSEIQNLIKNFNESNKSSDNIMSLLNEIEEISKGENKKNQRIVEINNSLDFIEIKITDLKKSIAQVKSDQKYRDYIQLKQKLVSFQKGKDEIKNQIEAQFTKISRPLSRYEYSSSLEKDQKNLLSQLVNEPFDALDPKNKDSIIMILENVRKGIQSNAISVKDNEKSLRQLTETEEILEPLIKKVTEFEEKRHRIENQISEYDTSDLIKSELELKKFYDQKKDFENKILALKKEIVENQKKIPKIISEIESQLKSFTNTKYTIRRNNQN